VILLDFRKEDEILILYLRNKLQTRAPGIPMFHAKHESFSKRVIGSFRRPSIPLT